MHIILGGTGHVGSATAEALLARGEPVTIVARSEEKAETLRRKGAQVAVADILDTKALRAIFAEGKRLYVLNPPASPNEDIDALEKATIACILFAIKGSNLEKIVGHSSYGAQKGERIGDLGTLYTLEEGLKLQPIPFGILRAAYYMTNWDGQIETAKEDGVLTTFFPPDFQLAMVAPQDLGEAAADLMMEPADKSRLVHVEGPQRYSSADVATTIAERFGRPVAIRSVPSEKREQTYRSLGFSDAAAKSYAGMTEAAIEASVPPVDETRRGKVTLKEYFRIWDETHPIFRPSA